MSETLQVSAKFAEINLRIYGPQVVTAARTLAAHHGSTAARENLDVFVDMWAWLLADAARLARELLDLTDDSRPDKQQYSSLPRPGVSTNRNNFVKYSIRDELGHYNVIYMTIKK